MTKDTFKKFYDFQTGQAFVEVEPDQEYFVAVSKPLANYFTGALKVEILVVGQSMGYFIEIRSERIVSPHFDYAGNWSYKYGMSKMTLMKFVIPNIVPGAHKPCCPHFGKVECKVFQVANPEYKSSCGGGDDDELSFRVHISMLLFLTRKQYKRRKGAFASSNV